MFILTLLILIGLRQASAGVVPWEAVENGIAKRGQKPIEEKVKGDLAGVEAGNEKCEADITDLKSIVAQLEQTYLQRVDAEQQAQRVNERRFEALESELNTIRGEENETAFINSESGPVMFSVVRKGGVNLALHQTLIFNDVVTNVGDGYNTNSGIFTCPVSGYYHFILNVLSENNRNAQMETVKESVIIQNVAALGRTGGNSGTKSASSSVIVHCQRGEHVWVRCQYIYSGDGTADINGGGFTSFTGLLVQLDE